MFRTSHISLRAASCDAGTALLAALPRRCSSLVAVVADPQWRDLAVVNEVLAAPQEDQLGLT